MPGKSKEHGADAGRGSHRGCAPAKTLLPLDDVLGCLKDASPATAVESDLGITFR